MAEFVAVRVAEWLEYGLAVAGARGTGNRVREIPGTFLDREGNSYRAGALGLILIGRYGDPAKAFSGWQQVSNVSLAGKFDAAARLLGISVALARVIEINHRNGASAAEIAGQLRIGTLGLRFGLTSAPAEVVAPARPNAVREYRRAEVGASAPAAVAVATAGA